MKITLEREDINQAIINYIGQQGFSTEDTNCSVTITKGRGNDKLTAEIVITELQDAQYTGDSSGMFSDSEPESDQD